METVVRLAARGDGVTDAGRFIAGAAPGDTVVDGAVVPGPNRAHPPCRHFPECGGCQLQHVGEAALAMFVRERVKWALASADLAAEVMPAHLSPPHTRRRASLRAVRADGRVLLGFNAEGTHRLVDIRDCYVLRPELFALVEPLRMLLAKLLPPRGVAGITMTLTGTGVDLLIANVAADGLDSIEVLTAFAQAHDIARLSIEGPGGIETIVERRVPLAHGVVLPPGAFLQATADGEAALVAAVLACVADAPRVADLFCGVGTFAVPLAARATVTAADASGPAVAALTAARLPGVSTAHRDLFRRPYIATELKTFDAVVFDPPRAGAQAQAAELAKSTVPRVVAVSCNPNTFARDAATLAAGGYRLGRVWPIGQFRWSTHIELAAEFRR